MLATARLRIGDNLEKSPEDRLPLLIGHRPASFDRLRLESNVTLTHLPTPSR